MCRIIKSPIVLKVGYWKKRGKTTASTTGFRVTVMFGKTKTKKGRLRFLYAFAHETFADNQYKVIDQGGGTVTVKELENYIQFGPFLGTNILGILDFLGINYSVECKFKYAVYNQNVVSLNPEFAID